MSSTRKSAKNQTGVFSSTELNLDAANPSAAFKARNRADGHEDDVDSFQQKMMKFMEDASEKREDEHMMVITIFMVIYILVKLR